MKPAVLVRAVRWGGGMIALVPRADDVQTETLTTFEFTSDTAAPQPNSVLFIGGLGDGLATTEYLADVAAALKQTSWSIFSVTLSSAYQGWGFGHLDRDTDEIARCVEYIRDYKKAKFGEGCDKVVLMGHSTGSQCVLHYLSRPNPHTTKPAFDPSLEHVERPVVNGAIMQAPVSDREAVQWVIKMGFLGRTPVELQATYDRLVAMARAALRRDESTDTMLPISLTSQFGYPSNTPVSCRRFLSLVSPDSPESPSEDDLFSSDLADEQHAKTFGAVRQNGLLQDRELLVFTSGADASIPDWVDKEFQLSRWQRAADAGGKAIWDTNSCVIPNASHALSNDDQAEPRRILIQKVLTYLGTSTSV